MNDNELITLVRESFTDVHSATAVEQIASRSRQLRARRLGLGATAVAVLVVAAAVHISMPASNPNASNPNASQSPSTHPRGGKPVNGPPVQLAAWTVAVQPDGSVRVTFREATDPGGLQDTLRADGVPASVTFSGKPNPACQPYHPSGGATPPAFGQRFGGTPNIFGGPGDFGNPSSQYSTPDALVIHPAALPSGAGLQIETSGTPGAADDFHFSVNLVKVSAQCTGS